MHFGKRIKEVRLKLGYSQEELCNRLRFAYPEVDINTVKRTAIVQWESGATKEIEGANLLKVAKVLGVSPVWLRFGIEEQGMSEETQEIDTEYKDSIICPYCGYNDEYNCSEYGQEDDTWDCASCGKWINVYVHVQINYSTKKAPCMNDEEPHDFKNIYPHYDGMTTTYRCTKCDKTERRDNPNYMKK